MFKWLKNLQNKKIEEALLNKFIEETQWKNNPYKGDSQKLQKITEENLKLKRELIELEEQNIALMKINEELRHNYQQALIDRAYLRKIGIDR